jgi:hypothetical protein
VRHRCASSLQSGGLTSLRCGTKKSRDRFVVRFARLAELVAGKKYENQRAKFREKTEKHFSPPDATARPDARAQHVVLQLYGWMEPDSVEKYVWAVLRLMISGTKGQTRMNAARKSIVVNAPAAKVYERWLRGEDFPKFITAIKTSCRLDATHFAVSVSLNGQQHEAVLEFILRVPERRLVWRALGNQYAAGVVSFTPRTDQITSVALTIMSTSGGIVSHRIGRYLQNFKLLIESELALKKVVA